MAQKFSFPRICIALGVPDTAKLLERASREADAGESFLEFRLDYLDRPETGCDAIRDFLKRHAECLILATCRRHQNHGKFNGSIESQIRILDAAVEAGARAVDVEIETAEAIPGKLGIFQGRAKVIVSYHNYETTPKMDAVLRRLQKVPADAYKLATTARKPTDIARVLELARENPRVPLVLLAMGETGFPTRVLSASFGGLFTYAAPLSMEGTAAGQVSAKQLRHFYRVDKFTKSAKVFGVVADPVRHSISPAVHNRAFQSRRVDAVYVPMLVAPAQIKDLFALAESLPLAGFSVTIPHKQRVMRYLDHIEPAARRIGAVNTVWKKAGKWRGANTDVDGIKGPLGRRLRLAGASILIAGNGGAARSAVCALSDAGAKLTVCGRNPDRVRSLAKVFSAEALSIADAQKRDFDALVHATPVGMFPHGDGCFFAGRIPAGIVFDMVYNPMETVLLKRAKQQGKTVIGGIEMFIEQAVRQFEIWTGDAAPRAAMEKAALDALENRI